MHTVETIMTLVDAHARDTLKKFSGSKVDPEVSRTAVKKAVAEVLSPPGVVILEEAAQPVPMVKPQASKRPAIFGKKP